MNKVLLVTASTRGIGLACVKECAKEGATMYMVSLAGIPYMAANGGGSIISISFISGDGPDISQIAYGMSKGAIHYLTQLIAVQCARENNRCNAVLPGMTATDAVTLNHNEAEFAKSQPVLSLIRSVQTVYTCQ